MKRWLIPILATGLLGLVGVAYVKGWTAPLVEQARALTQSQEGQKAKDPALAGPPIPQLTGDGLLSVAAEQQTAFGLRDASVVSQTEPMHLELQGTTGYNPDTLTKVRPRFDALVQSVTVTLGQSVKVGEPLVELYSAQLAEAKSACEVAKTQWEHDQRLLQAREPLARSNTISQQLLLDTRNDEIRSRLQYKVARDKLEVYGLSVAEIDALASEEGAEKARMTIHSPASGVVISREVVPGNIYDPNDVLLVIAPVDRLWVWGNVFESNLALVTVGQTWKVRFPYLDDVAKGQVEYVANQVDLRTHAVRIRGSIANPGGRLKADMLVRTLLEIPPSPGRTVIPRAAMVVADGGYFVFVRKPGSTDLFERRKITPVQEKADYVIVGEGLKPSEVVVTSGSLILSQALDSLEPLAAPLASAEGPASPPEPR